MYAVILAAGKGSRMMSHLPKPLLTVGGKPMLHHVIKAAISLVNNEENVCVVYGHGGDLMQKKFSEYKNIWAHQHPQLGTGDAVKVACDVIPDGDAPVLILYGDVPLISAKTLMSLNDTFISTRSALTLLTAKPGDPGGYGRIVRCVKNKLIGIVEQKDASESQRRIMEVNTGIMIVDGGCLRRWVNSLSNANAQGEFYLTDIVKMAYDQGYTLSTVEVEDAREALGANDPDQLLELEGYFNKIKS
jgi:bifunctional UDP-N-acetylglucosamine pyrophosphorylase/glucosamine-1-phosphate N-acetyltransferase